MSNIVLLIIILGKIESLTSRMFWTLLIYIVFLSAFISLYACETNYNDRDVFNCIKDMMKKFKVKITLIILIISGVVSTLIPTKEELIVYYGSKQITVQNYHIAKDELLGFVKDIKKEIKGD